VRSEGVRSEEIKIETGTVGSADGTELFWRGWVPANPRAALLFVHGLAEHSGRYDATALSFAKRQLACYGLDLRGHGMSQGRRVHVASFDDYLADVDAALALARERHPGLPLFLVGHSMGGLIAVLYVLAKPEAVAGAVVSSPLLAPHPSAEPSCMLRAVSRILSAVAPRLLIASSLDTSALSRDPSVVDAYVNDPLVSHKVSPRWFTALQTAVDRAHQGAPALAAPTLLMQSGADRLVDPEATRRWARAAHTEFCEFVWWDGLFHEMFNEPEREQVLERAATWIEGQLDAG
jgi:alpha-beta hydrolase superfamily lysophospholipase